MRPTFPLPFNRNPNPVITEPEHNVYGRFKVLARTDRRFVVHDTRQAWPFSFGAVFQTEREARVEAALLARLDESPLADPDALDAPPWCGECGNPNRPAGSLCPVHRK